MGTIERVIRVLYNRVFRREEMNLMLEHVHFEHGKMEITARHEAVSIIASELGKYFQECGGVNYIEMQMFDPATIGLFTVTIRKARGLEPSQVNDKLRHALESIYELTDDKSARETARLTLVELGYLQDEAAQP